MAAPWFGFESYMRNYYKGKEVMTKRNPERFALIRIKASNMAELLGLPPGASVDAVQVPADLVDTFEFRIRGAGHPLKEGNVIPVFRAMARRAIVLDCDLPMDEN